MSSLETLFESLRDTPGLLGISLSTVNNFVRLAVILKTAILHRQTRTWNAAVAPAILPPHILTFIAGRLALSENNVRALWDSLHQEIWSREGAVLDDDMVPPSTLDALSSKYWLCMSFTSIVCYNVLTCLQVSVCFFQGHRSARTVSASIRRAYYDGRRSRRRLCSSPWQMVYRRGWPCSFTVIVCCLLHDPSWLHANTCVECKTVYYPNYSARDELRQYYEGVPAFIQVSDHSYVERHVLEHFTVLSVLSWTSATNAAHIYHESMSKLERSRRNEPRFRLRTEHVWDGFVALALLRDAELHATILQAPHGGVQKNRYTDAMRLRNERIRRSGQPEYAHWCTKCHRRFDQPDGTTSEYLYRWAHSTVSLSLCYSIC